MSIAVFPLAHDWMSARRAHRPHLSPRRAIALASRAAMHAYHGLAIEGRENLPARGPFLLVSNHSSHLDAPILQAALPMRLTDNAHAAAATDYFFTRLPRRLMAKLFMNAIAFDRSGHVAASLHACRSLLDSGGILIVFPEGTRSTSGAIGEFKRGVGELVAGTSIPVVPCYIAGARDAWPKGAIIPRPTKLRLIIGPPRVYAHLPRGKQSALRIAADLRRAILQLQMQTDTSSVHAEKELRHAIA
jgi:1-acyl-sn-glycerol-3-phosphate acyltransferase